MHHRAPAYLLTCGFLPNPRASVYLADRHQRPLVARRHQRSRSPDHHSALHLAHCAPKTLAAASDSPENLLHLALAASAPSPENLGRRVRFLCRPLRYPPPRWAWPTDRRRPASGRRGRSRRQPDLVSASMPLPLHSLPNVARAASPILCMSPPSPHLRCSTSSTRAIIETTETASSLATSCSGRSRER
jgi:hypothetical protein